MAENMKLLGMVEESERGSGQNLSFRCMNVALALPISRVRELIEYAH